MWKECVIVVSWMFEDYSECHGLLLDWEECEVACEWHQNVVDWVQFERFTD